MRLVRQVGSFGAALVVALALVGCGASPPRESDVYHDARLRPGALAAENEVERELLARLAESPGGETVQIGGRAFVVLPSYEAASGRRCTPFVEPGGRRRLACASESGWVLVPEVLGDTAPFAAVTTSGPP